PPVTTATLPSSNRITLFSFPNGPLVYHPQNNLTSRVPSRSLLIRLTRLGKGKHRINDGSDLSCVDQCADLDQLLPVGFHHKPDRAHIMHLRPFKGGLWADN